MLHNKFNGLGYETIHGIMPVNINNNSVSFSKSADSLKSILFGVLPSYKIKFNSFNVEGHSKGILVGGNLSLLASQLGSSTQLCTKNKILFIEEIGEYKYHIDRMLHSLKRAGYFKNCSGLIVGNMIKIKVK